MSNADDDFELFDGFDGFEVFEFNPGSQGNQPNGFIVINLGDLFGGDGIDPRMVSFQGIKKPVEKTPIPTVTFNNPKYNISLNVSYAQDLKKYEEFQNMLQAMAQDFDTNILDEIAENKPAAIIVETDRQSALNSGNLMIALKASMTNEDTVELVEAVNFVSEEGNNMLLPPCQLLEAFRHDHLHTINTGTKLTKTNFRKFTNNFEKDLKNQKPTKNGDLMVRSVK